MGHRSGWWRVWDAVGRMGCGSRSRGTRAISSCIHNFSLHPHVSIHSFRYVVECMCGVLVVHFEERSVLNVPYII